MKRIRGSSIAAAMIIGLAIPAEAQQVSSHVIGGGAQVTDPEGNNVTASTVNSVETKTGSSNTLIVHFTNGYYVPSNSNSHEPLTSIIAAYSATAPEPNKVSDWFAATSTKNSSAGIAIGAPDSPGQFSLTLYEEDWSPIAKTWYVGLKSVGGSGKAAYSPDAKAGTTDLDASPPETFTIVVAQTGPHFYDMGVTWSSPAEDAGSQAPLPVTKYLVRTTYAQPPAWDTADPKQIYVEVLPVWDLQSFVITAPHDGFFTVFVQAVDDAGQAGVPASATVFIGVEEKKADQPGNFEKLGCGASAMAAAGPGLLLVGLALMLALHRNHA